LTLVENGSIARGRLPGPRNVRPPAGLGHIGRFLMKLNHMAMMSVAAAALFAFSAGPAPAATEQEITDAIKALFAASESGATIELGTPTANGDTLVYTDAVVKTTAADGPGEARIKTLTVTGGDVNDRGGLAATQLLAEGIEMTSGTDKVTIASIGVEGLDVTPQAGETPMSAKLDTAAALGIVANTDGQPPVNIEAIRAEASDYVDAYPRSGSVAIEGMDVDVAASPDDPTGGQLKALGYDRLRMNLYVGGTWDDAAATMSLDEFSIDADDVGSLTLTGVFGGFTPDVVAELQKTEPSMEAMSKVTVNEAALSFSDASITGKLLDMQAKQMGADRAAFVEQITAALPLMLSAIGNPGFQEKLAGAASAFLKDPKNITLSIAPANPVDVMTLIMTGQTAPQTLPDLLGAEVSANEAEEE
jgi:hypothetical protein